MTKKRKRGRPHAENPMVHTAVVLPRDLLERLRTDAKRSERGLSTEIRQRLANYDVDDPETKSLIECIKSLANNLASDLGKSWHESEYAKAALAGGIMAFLGPLSAARDIPGHTDNPETVGRTHARLITAARRGGEENDARPTRQRRRQ